MNKLAFFYPYGHEAHFEVGHPERPERVEEIKNALISADWWGDFEHMDPAELADDVLYAVHDPTYIDMLQEVCRRGGHLDGDTYTTTESWKLAVQSAGGAVSVASYVWRSANTQPGGIRTRGFALTRPPGHHATPERGMGFCLLNNVALAAEHLLSEEGASRLAIIDLDLHHGNGTQDVFWRRDDVFYISTHQSPLYPGTGYIHETGEGRGEGYTANFPLPPATGDEGFQSIMQSCILPLLDRYHPEMILVSFGFDTHWRDPLGHLQLSAAGYGELIHNLCDWADQNCSGRIGLFLEGGYDLEAGRVCTLAVVAALMDRSWEDPLGESPRRDGRSWQVVARQAREIWKL